MSSIAKSARTSILPAGSVPPTDSLEHGSTIQLTVLRAMENNELELEYPNGYSRTHQAEDVTQLIPKIVNNLRARYGVDSVNVISAPAITEGAVIIMEVFNG